MPYSQIRILARARWQLFHLRGVLSRGGLKPHVVLAGDSALLEDAEDADPQIPSSDMAGNSSDKVCIRTDVSRRRKARQFSAIVDGLCQKPHASQPDLPFENLWKSVKHQTFFACLAYDLCLHACAEAVAYFDSMTGQFSKFSMYDYSPVVSLQEQPHTVLPLACSDIVVPGH